MGTEIVVNGCRIWIPHDLPDGAVVNANADIHIYLDSGAHYAGTLYTPENIRHLMQKAADQGDRAGSLYMFDPAMLVVRDLSVQTIRQAIAALMARDELASVFIRGD